MVKAELPATKIPWRYKRDGELPVSAPITVVTNTEMITAIQEGQPPVNDPIVFLTGYGHDPRVRRVVEEAGRRNVHMVGVGFDYNKLPAKRVAVEAGSREVPHVVAEHVREVYAISPDKKMATVGDSKGGGMIADGVTHQQKGYVPQNYGDLAFVAPVGFRTDASLREKDGRERSENALVREFVRKFGWNALLVLTHLDPADLAVAPAIWRQIGFDVMPRRGERPFQRFREKVGYAVTLQAQEEIVAHAEAGNRVLFVAGARDRVIPAAETQAAVQAVEEYTEGNPSFIVVPQARHESPESTFGQVLIFDHAVPFLHKKGPGNEPGQTPLAPAA